MPKRRNKQIKANDSEEVNGPSVKFIFGSENQGDKTKTYMKGGVHGVPHPLGRVGRGPHSLPSKLSLQERMFPVPLATQPPSFQSYSVMSFAQLPAVPMVPMPPPAPALPPQMWGFTSHDPPPPPTMAPFEVKTISQTLQQCHGVGWSGRSNIEPHDVSTGSGTSSNIGSETEKAPSASTELKRWADIMDSEDEDEVNDVLRQHRSNRTC